MPDITTLEQYGKADDDCVDLDIDSKSTIRLLDGTMQQSELQALGQHIQIKLQQLPSPIRLRVRCAFREEALLVLAEHLLHVEPAPRQIFTTVTEALQEYTPELMKSGLVRSGVGGVKFLPVRIYLRVAGYQQPYDSFVFSLKPLAPTTSTKPLVPVVVPPPQPATPLQAQVESEIVAVEPVAEVEPIESVAVEPVAEVEPVESVAIEPVAVEPVAEVEPIVEVEVTEQPELLDNPIATVAPTMEHAPVIETSNLQTDWILDRTIAEVIPVEIAEPEPLTSEAAVNEPVLVESIEAEQLPALEDPTFEKNIELPIAEEAIAAPLTIALEDQPVEPEAIEDLWYLEEIPSALEEITPPPELPFVPAAIAPTTDDVSPAADQTSLAQSEILDESKPAIILLEPIAEEPIAEEPIVEKPIMIQDEPESAINLQADNSQAEPTVAEPSQPATFSQTILPLHISTLDTQQTPQDFFHEYSGLTNAELIDSARLVDVEETETVNKPQIIEVFDSPEFDTTSSESAPALELKEAPEPENLATDHIPPAEATIAAESAIAETLLTDELDTHVDDPTTHLSTASLAPKDLVTQPPGQPVRAPQMSSSSIMLGTAITLFGLLGGWYILSRPCVLGSSCQPLQQAQQISQSAFQTVQSTESAIAIAKAYEDLGTASKLLTSIPGWSEKHQAAQALLADNNSKSIVIGQLVRTLRKGNEAANRSQNPPHPLPEWREIQRLWRESISALERIPNDTAIYPIAQRKATEYRANLDGINKRVVVEQQAQEEVENAKKTAQLAETRTGIATSAEGWQEVYTSWQAATNLLKNVPSGAAARLEAEELLKIYQSKLAAAGARRDQENTAITAYTEAIAQADQAQSFQQKNRWQEAIVAWESAVANVQKVAQGTAPYAQTQPLIATYQTALTQAQGGLRISEAIQAAKPALDRSCGGTPKVCQYDAAPTAIRVQITYGYDQMVESAMTSAQTQGNSTAQAGVVSQVNTFLQELALISQTAQVPIDLYNANGSKFGTYSPIASGFIPQ